MSTKKNQSNNPHDGYEASPDGYHFDKVISIRLTDEDIKEIEAINKDFFEGELTHSTMGRILMRKGIHYYKKMRNSLDLHGL